MYNFGQSVSQNLSSTVVSSAVVMSSAQTLTTDLGVFVVNGIGRTNSVAVAVNDAVQVQITSASAFSTTLFAKVTTTANLEVSFFLATTKDQTTHRTPTQCYFTKPAFLDRATSITTSGITVAGVSSDANIPVSIPNVYSAVILKNGVISGQSTIAALNDVIQVRFTTPLNSNLDIHIPLAIGNMNTWFSSITRQATQQPTPFYLLPVLGATPGSIYNSSAVTIAGLDTDVSLSLEVTIGATIKKNNVVVGRTATVVNGDQVIFSATASLNARDAVFVNIYAGTYTTIWSITNVDAPAYVADDYLGVLPINYPVTASNTDIGLLYLNSTVTGHIPLTAPSNNVIDGNDTLVLLSYFGNVSYIVDAVTNTLVKTLTFAANSKPVASDYYPKAGSTATSLIVAFNGSNTVSVYDSSYILKSYFTLPFSPDGMCVGNDNLIYVSNKATNTVLKYTSSGSLNGTWTVNSPTLLKCFESGVYAVCADGGIYTLLSTSAWIDNIRCTDFDCVGNTFAFIDVYDNSIKVYNSNELVKTIFLTFIPTSIALDADGTMYVTDTYRSLYVISDSSITPYATNAMVVGLGLKNSIVYAIETLKNVNLSAFTQDSTIPQLTYTPTNVSDSALTSTFSSPEITVSNVFRTAQMNVEPYAGVSVLHNGHVVAGTKVAVIEGDIIQFQLESSSKYNTLVKAYATCCTNSASFSITTAANLLPETLTFNELLNKSLDEVVMTEAMTISGLTNGSIASLSITSTSPAYGFLLNGEFVGASVEVVNGDQLALLITVDGLYGSTTNYYITATDAFAGVSIVGSVPITTILLDGPIVWPTFATLTQNTVFEATVYDIDSVEPLYGIKGNADVCLLSPSANCIRIESLDYTTPTLQVAGSIQASHHYVTSEVSEDVEVRWSMKFTPIVPIDTLCQRYTLHEVEGSTSKFKDTLKDAHLINYAAQPDKQEDRLYYVPLYGFTSFKQVPVMRQLSFGSVVQHGSSKTTMEGFALYGQVAQHTADQNYIFGISSALHETPGYYTTGVQPSISAYQPLYILHEYNHFTPIEQFFTLGVNASEAYYVMDNFQLNKDLYFTEQPAAFNMKVDGSLFEYESTIGKTQFAEIATEGFEFSPRGYATLLGSAIDFRNTLNPVDQSFDQYTHQVSVVYANFSYLASSMYSVSLANFIKVTDLVVIDPTPASCNLHGLFNTVNEAQADSVLQGFVPSNVNIVMYKGCRLWTVNPIAETINCGSSGSLTPVSWAVNQSITPLFAGVTREAGWVGGG